MSTALPESRAGGRELSERILTTIAKANETLEQATRKLIRLAELAYGQRDYEGLRAITEALQAIPYAAAQRAGMYYQAVLLKRVGDLDRAAELLATINAPRALHTLATIYECKGEWAEATRLHVESIRAARDVDLFTLASAGLQLATVRAIEGDHAASLQAFHALWPVLRVAAQFHPHLFTFWHNAVAVELSELGRFHEARRAIAIAQASPLAHRYPEIAETAREIAQAQPTRVAGVVVEPQQEDAETTEATPVTITVQSAPPRRHRFIRQSYAHTLLNPRASPRAPPSLL